jgi:hypothetical protein
MRSRAALATITGFAVCQSLGVTETSALLEGDTERSETKWEFSSSTFTCLAQHARDYANPNFTADRDWLHRDKPRAKQALVNEVTAEVHKQP